MQYSELAEGDPLPNKVEINLNVLCALMLDWVAGEIYSTDVVTVDQGGTARWVAKFKKKLTQPSSFSNTIRYSTIFGLGAGAGDRMLTLGGLGHQIIPEEHCVARGRPASVWTPSPVSVRVYNKLCR
jgi:hypothetical protein